MLDFIYEVLATLLALLIYKGLKRWYAGLESSPAEPNIIEPAATSPPEAKLRESLGGSNEDDLDLIAQFRAASGPAQSNSSSSNSSSSNSSSSNSSSPNLISELSGIAESSGEHSFDQMASHLISVTRNMAGVLDESNAISPEKKAEIGAFLKAAPELLSKISEMDSNTLAALFTSATTTPGKPDSQFLMDVLDQLE